MTTTPAEFRDRMWTISMYPEDAAHILERHEREVHLLLNALGYGDGANEWYYRIRRRPNAVHVTVRPTDESIPIIRKR